MKFEIAIAIMIPLGIIILIVCCLAYYADDIHTDLNGIYYHRIPTEIPGEEISSSIDEVKHLKH
jgi:hypothetical protein